MFRPGKDVLASVSIHGNHVHYQQGGNNTIATAERRKLFVISINFAQMQRRIQRYSSTCGIPMFPAGNVTIAHPAHRCKCCLATEAGNQRSQYIPPITTVGLSDVPADAPPGTGGTALLSSCAGTQPFRTINLLAGCCYAASFFSTV